MSSNRASFVVVTTPYRISFVGGGTDLPAVYRSIGGAVVSVALRHMLVTTAVRSVEPELRLLHDTLEIAAGPEELRHPICREALRATGWRRGLRLALVGALPPSSGLGSSSTVAVGVFHALSALGGQTLRASALAEAACAIEIERLGAPIGKQDQYAAAFGGLNRMVFGTDGRVEVTRLDDGYSDVLAALENHLLLFKTGTRRSASKVLSSQSTAGVRAVSQLQRMRDAAFELSALIARRPFDIAGFGALVRENWDLKRELNPLVTSPLVDEWIARALDAGAYGGKLIGAGWHGCVLIVADPARHPSIRRAIGHPSEIPVRLGQQGSTVVAHG